MQDIKKHTRIIDTFTGPLEKRILRWLASKMPAWMNPDILTGIGVMGAVVIVVGFYLANFDKNFLWLASLGFVINWFGDSLDGTLARYRKIERPVYGFFIDHTVDALNEVLVFIGLGLSPYVRFDLACLALVGYLLLSVLVYIRTCVKGEFTISYGRLGPTEVRILAIAANTLIFFAGNPTLTLAGLDFTVYDWIVALITTLLFAFFIGSMLRQARILSRLEP